MVKRIHRNCGEVINCYPHNNDVLIAKVIIDVIDNNLDARRIKEILGKHNRVYDARDLDGYRKIKSLIGNKTSILIISSQVK